MTREVQWFSLLALLIPIGLFGAWGSSRVPFHPDEASLLYQSRDLETLFQDPMSLAWSPQPESELDQEYRALNAALPKYMLGLGRRLAGYGPESVSSDWDWSKSWDANLKAGALPSGGVLQGARYASLATVLAAVALAFPLGRQMEGPLTGALSAALLGTHALVLLHGRRAMAEGTLVLGVVLALVGILHAHRRPWLAGLCCATAAAAKFSGFALAPVGLLAAIWPAKGKRAKGVALRGALSFLVPFLLLFLLLHPLFWSYPVRAATATWTIRQDLLEGQTAAIGVHAPGMVLDDPATRSAVLVAQLFILEPQHWEVGNYRAELTASIESYEAIPGHSVMRGWVGGGSLLGFTLLGIIGSFRYQEPCSNRQRRPRVLLALASVAQAGALLLSVPLPFQRYVMPLVPMVCLWAALGLSSFVATTCRAVSKMRRPRGSSEANRYSRR
jgi:hypothetical protein